MSGEVITDLWDKIDRDQVATKAAEKSKAEEGTSTAEAWQAFWRFRRPFLDVCGTVLWLYWIVKVFFADVDQWIFGDLADYRFFAYLVGAAVLVLWFRKTGRILMGFAYIIGFPLVVLCWKLPKWFINSGDFVTFFAAVNAVTSVLGNLRYSVITFVLAAFAALAIASFSSDIVLEGAAAVTLALVALALYRTVRFSVQPSQFLRVQQQAIRRFADSGAARNLTEPDEDLRKPEIEKFNSVQLQQFAQNLAQGVVAYRALGYWAYQLERYRRSAASLFLNALGYIWLTVKVMAGFALANYALYQADPGAYVADGNQGFLTFIRYAIAGLYGSEIDALTPHSDAASAVSIMNFIVGLVIFSGLVVSSFLGFRAARNESEMRATVAEIRRESHALDARIRENYNVTIPEAISRLRELQVGAADLLLRLVPKFPDPLDEDPDPAR